MNRDKLKRLLRDYGRQLPEDRVFSDDERSELQARLAEESEVEESDGPQPERQGRMRRTWWLLVPGAVAAAAVIAIVWMLPTEPPLDLDIAVVTSVDAGHLTRGEERFEVEITVSETVYVHLVVLDKSGRLTVMRAAQEGAKRIEAMGTLGSYRVWSEDRQGQAVRRTYAIILALKEPITRESLAEAVPDQLPARSDAERELQLTQLCHDLEKRLDCVVRFKRIPPSSK